MTEGQFTSKLLGILRKDPVLARAEIWKVSDRFNAGRPDFQIVIAGKTTYFEVKMHPHWLTPLQEYMLKRLSPRAYMVYVDKDGGVSLRVNFNKDDMALRCDEKMTVRRCAEIIAIECLKP